MSKNVSSPNLQTPVIIAENLLVKYDDFIAVNNVSFIVKRGEIFGFLGPNGSGKTTVIKTLCGLVRPSSGKGKILGFDIIKDSHKIKERIGYMSQKFSLYEYLSVNENIDFYGTIYGLSGRYLKQRKNEVIALLDLEKYLSRKAGNLSGGWKQRLALACSIIHNPDVVFLDEPTAGIDPVARRDLWDLLFKLSAQGITFFVTTHYMDEAERCSSIAYIYLSKLITFGTPEELKMLPDVSPPNTVRIEIICKQPSLTLSFVKNFSYVLEATIFGQSIHLLMSTLQPIDKLISDLSALGIQTIKVQPISPSLEDVFVTLTKRISTSSPAI